MGNSIRSFRRTRVRDRLRAGVAGPLSMGWDGSAGVAGRPWLSGGAGLGSLRDRTPRGPPACAGRCSVLLSLPLARLLRDRAEPSPCPAPWPAGTGVYGDSFDGSVAREGTEPSAVHAAGATEVDLKGRVGARRLPRGGRTGWRLGVGVPFVPGALPAGPCLASGLPPTSELLSPVWGKRGGVWLHGARCPGPRSRSWATERG